MNGERILRGKINLSRIYTNFDRSIADRWGVPVTDLMSNHYNPFYYGDRTAEALVGWFKAKNITLWIYTGWQYTPEVLSLLEEERPSFLIFREGIYDIAIFEVNSTALSNP